jgi:hypothetical protein
VQGQPTKEASVTKLKRTLALALAGGTLAIGVPVALAAGGSDSTTSNSPSNPTFIQDEGGQNPGDQGRQAPGDGLRGDCPEHEGGQQGGSSESGGSPGAPSESGGSTEL